MNHDTAHPINPAPLAEADVYAACKAFVLAYALPALAPDNVALGWQNRTSLPPGSPDYGVISILSATQRGTTVETFKADDPDPEVSGVLSVQGLMEVSVQVDFCAETDVARQRAQRLAVLTRSSIGVQFFNKYGMSALYAEAVKDCSTEDDANQLVRRFSTVLHLSLWVGDCVQVPYFQSVAARLENVNQHHPQED